MQGRGELGDGIYANMQRAFHRKLYEDLATRTSTEFGLHTGQEVRNLKGKNLVLRMKS